MKKMLPDMSKQEIRAYKENLENDYAENLELIKFYSQALEDRTSIEETKENTILLAKFVLGVHDILERLEAIELYE